MEECFHRPDLHCGLQSLPANIFKNTSYINVMKGVDFLETPYEAPASPRLVMFVLCALKIGGNTVHSLHPFLLKFPLRSGVAFSPVFAFRIS